MTVEMPLGWVLARLEDVAKPSAEKVDPRECADLPYVGLEHIGSRTGQLCGRGTATDVKSTKSVFRRGDVLYGKLRPYLRKVWPAEFDGVCSTDILVYRASPAVDSSYLAYVLRSEDVAEYAVQKSAGINLPRVNARALGALEIWLPPIPEQRRIVAKLDEVLASGRAARMALDVVPDLLERYRQAVLTSAFSGNLTADWRASRSSATESAARTLEIVDDTRRAEWSVSRSRGVYRAARASGEGAFPLPPTWRWASLEQVTSAVASICYGVVQPGEQVEGGVPLVRVCDVNDGRAAQHGLRSISPEVDREYARSRLQGGEVLVTVVGTIGRVAVAPATLAGANIARAVARLRPVPPISAEWLAYALMAPHIRNVLTRESREVARKTLNVGSLAQVLVPIAPVDEMLEVVRRIDLHLESQERQTIAVRSAAGELDRLEQAMLAKAFRGELVAQDPGDEPATALLEQVRAASPGPASRARRGRTLA